MERNYDQPPYGLEIDQDAQAADRAAAAHRDDDPHCTCNDCVAHYATHTIAIARDARSSRDPILGFGYIRQQRIAQLRAEQRRHERAAAGWYTLGYVILLGVLAWLTWLHR